MRDTPQLDRRNVLKGLGSAAALAGVGGAGFLAATGGAAAAVELNASISDTSYSGDQGDVDYVAVEIDKTINWDGFDVPLRYIGFRHEITLDDGGSTPWHVLYDQRSGRLTDWSSEGNGGDGWGGPGEYIESHGGDKGDYLKGTAKADVAWAIISDGSHSAEYDSVQTPVDWTATLSEGDDGATTTHTVRWKTTLTFYTEDSNGDPVQITGDDGVSEVTGETSFAVTVTNEGGELTGSEESGNSTAG
jgi:hypothetical protein